MVQKISGITPVALWALKSLLEKEVGAMGLGVPVTSVSLLQANPKEKQP